MIWFKACPRCHQGDLVFNDDIYGVYKQCLQCGHIVELVDASTSAPELTARAFDKHGKKKSLAA